METSPKALRSEEEIDMPLIDAPIRIHKYSQELDEEDYGEDLLINVPKRPTVINNGAWEESAPTEFDFDQEPSSIGDLVRLMTSRDDYDEPMSVQKRQVADLDDMLEEMFYVSKEREPRLIRWLYLNRYSTNDNLKNEPTLINRLKSILKENIMIENIFNDMTNNEKINLANLPSSVNLEENQISSKKI